jgi:phosphate-selective porin OprO/OprP
MELIEARHEGDAISSWRRLRGRPVVQNGAAVALFLLSAGAAFAADEGAQAAPAKPSTSQTRTEPTNPKKPDAVVVSASSDGFSLQSANGEFRLQLKGLVQFDGRFFLQDRGNALTNTFLVRRARPILQGTVGRHFEFNLTPDFGGGTATVLDAYVVVRRSAGLAVRAGKFKPPIGAEHLQSDPDLLFTERAFPSDLEPNRDVGVQLAGDLAGGTVGYALGVFNGTPDGASGDLDTNDGKSGIGRVVLAPFARGKSLLKGLSFAIAGSTEKQSSTASGYRTGGQNPFFSYATGVTAAGTRDRWAPDLTFFRGPVGIIAEYVESRGRVTKATTSATVEPTTLRNRAWQVAASVVLTGDPASYKGVAIRAPFEPGSGHWGAVQLVARVNGFDADPGTFDLGFADIAKSARRARAWALGVNWLPTRNLKQAIGYERTTFVGGAPDGGDRPAENALFVRSELKF